MRPDRGQSQRTDGTPVADDKRYQIFVSSTFQDLAKQRKQAIEAILERRHIPMAMEGFSASHENDLIVIQNAIAQSQVYVLILGHRYGDIVPGRNISFTELEFEYAEEHRLRILAFILNDREIEERRSKLNPDNDRDANELNHREQLKRFHARVGAHSKKVWSDEDQFKAHVLNALMDELPKIDRPGFIREDHHPDYALLAEASQNEFIRDIVSQLRNFDKLYMRCLVNADLKREAARFFSEHYLSTILERKVSLFLESGSSLAYVARELGQHFRDQVYITNSGAANIGIITNNVLAYLEFWLNSRIPCSPFPWSPPTEATYGAFYGGIEKLTQLHPAYTLTELNREANASIERLMKSEFGPTGLEEPRLLLGAASGLQMTGKFELRFQESLSQAQRARLRDQLSTLRGPHVGSYHNKIFKRFMYKTEIPLVLFLTSDKIDCPIDVGRCHFILGDEQPWNRFVEEHPVAFCVGCSQDEADGLASLFDDLGFDIVHGQKFSSPTAFIARNRKFLEMFEKRWP